MQNCKICGIETETAFNINFKRTPVCEHCATSIFIQQAQSYVVNSHRPTKNLELNATPAGGTAKER